MDLHGYSSLMKVRWDVYDNTSILETVLIGEFWKKESSNSVNHQNGLEGVGWKFFYRAQEVAGCSIDKNVDSAEFFGNKFDSRLNSFLIPYIAWASKYAVIGSFCFECLNSFIDVLDFSANDIDSGTMQKELFWNLVTDAGCSSTNQNDFSLVDVWLENAHVRLSV